MRFVESAKLDSCVHCGLCLASCPTYLELGTEPDSPRGRIALIRRLEEGTLAPTREVTWHLDLCLGCRACETACPSGVPYGALIEAARPRLEGFRPAPARLARRMLAFALTTRPVREVLFAPVRLVAGVRGLARSRWTAFAAALPRDRRRLPAVLEPEGPTRGTAVLLSGCVADTLFSGTNLATARLLQRAGVRVVIPRYAGCCGALALHLGARARAAALAQTTARMLAAQAGAGGAGWQQTACQRPRKPG